MALHLEHWLQVLIVVVLCREAHDVTKRFEPVIDGTVSYLVFYFF